MRIGAWVLFTSAATSYACSGVEQGAVASEDYHSLESALVGPSVDGGPSQAVLVHVSFIDGGLIANRTCTGSYFASRVVLTAAHCLDGAFSNQVHVYFGDNFEADYADVADGNGFIVAPAPGEPSNFARADSFESHPEWDPGVVHPDLGVVYLDRELPFAPLPLARFHLGNSYVNKKAIVSGWGADTVTGPVSATGGQIQRTGRTTILGSPTAADYHPEDPNPGMLDPHIRRHVIKTDGTPPNANGCFGDSGGPLLVSKHGKTYVAGVNYWTGLSCADYNLFTRIDPFLPFLDEAERKGGKERVSPTFECVAPNADGTYTAYFGYDNANGVSVEIPYGKNNRLTADENGRRPTAFAPGAHPFQFGVKFEAKETVTWTLDNGCGRGSSVRVNKRSKACGEAQADQVECAAACEAQFASGCDVSEGFAACLDNCVSTVSFFAEVFPECKDEYSAFNACVASTPPGEDNWICDPDLIAYALTCGEQEAAIYTCLGY